MTSTDKLNLNSFIRFMIDELEGGAKRHRNKGETHDTAYGFYGKYWKLPTSYKEATDMYLKNFYEPYFGDLSMDLFLLQFSVNVGKERALRLVKDAETLMNKELDLEELWDIQQAYYDSLSDEKYGDFKEGWKNRIINTMTYIYEQTGYINL